MEVKYIRYLVALLFVLFQWVNVLGGADDWREGLILEGVKKLDALIAQNKANEEAGRSHLNSYIINLDGGWSQKGDFIEERGEGPNGKFTLLGSDELTLLDNDLKSFHALYSPKKEVGVYVIMVNNFQLLIRNQLPGNPEVQKLSDFAYYIDKDKQDQIKDLSKQMKGIVREVIDRTKNKGYTKQTYGILYGVVSTYDLNSPDLGTGIIQDQLEPVSYLSVFMDKSAATSMESYGIINREMPKGKDLVRSHATVYPRMEALIKGFEKGYLKSKAIASLEEEAVALGIKEGPGRTLFMNLPKEKTLTNEQKVAFAELCKYLNTETSGKSFAFHHPGLPNEIGQNGKDLYEQTWEYIYEKEVLTKEKFDKHFFENPCRDVDLIFANVDLWEGIDINAYNKNSPDYLSLGKLYEYSFADFKVRESHKNTSLFVVIHALEEAGKAEPLNTSGHYDQYLAKWKTDAAYIFIANWSAHWSKDILEAYAAQYVAASGILSTKAMKDAAIGSMVDYTLQVGLNWAFFANEGATIAEIAKDVDFYQIAASGAENAFSSSFSSQRTQVLLGAGISCMFDGAFEDGNLREDFNLEECAKGIASAVIANQISNFALAKLQKLDAEKLKRGLLRLGIPQNEWKSSLRWLGIKHADHIAEGVEKSLEELLSGLKKAVPSDQWDNFVDDFGKDAAKLAKFDANPKLLDSWKRFGNSPLRTNTKYLEAMTDFPPAWKIETNGGVTKIINGSGDELAELTESIIKAKGGNKGSWNELLNKPPIKNYKYQVDRYLYETDELGRVKKVKGELEYKERGRNEYQQGESVKLKDGVQGQDDGGHLIANILNGPGEQINYLPQTVNLNRGGWKAMENTWSEALQKGSKVEVEINPIFTGTSKRPTKFEVEYWIDGKYQFVEFDN